MPSSVVCPRCNASSTGYFCNCGNDLRALFNVALPKEEEAPRVQAAALPNPAGYAFASAPTSGMSAEGHSRFYFGLFLFIIGIAVTGGSYLLAAPGSSYTIAFGAIGVGAWRMLTGFAQRA